ncbi:ABC-type multidrug transport system ATPase subunit [Salinibacter ruber]|uniref:ABC transporter ATP-binding protein n=1 Tax=Salinibacter ruber TaxID=146919 RepID=UPI001ABAEE4F|nr:ABC transporter ATP-binding protein [Salinibacter ruber]MCS3628746.1 ABC-type multidrug transport system ATPase subunit [Salinibacter ruber]MCS3642895.1 ABC-type multidrug transport system ATPase subunit [Salinibacter ruber]MCS3656421.1 ABC-type multidrug transport system ATPase subunit [Salinibacter ruber]MCS3940431.1 ABC-type multidrug transport system ATPase subunit [Salinibacter ruber]MCS4145654.1 ABC-type multidrug transport system ATPase subunit [Salinibacter ruber]
MTLTIENVSKTYPNGTRALDDVSLTIPPGMFGLLGPNGAGKSTLMRTVAALQEPDTGSVHLGDINALEEKQTLRKRLGYLPQEVGVYDNVSAETLLDHFATLKGITDRSERRRVVDALLNRVNLDGARDQNLGGYSGGMKRRFGIAVALIGDPDLIIVDEPTAGLDPAERVRFLNLLSEIGEDSVVLLSTHIVADVRELCTQMAIIREGEIIFEGAPEAAIADLEGQIWRKTVTKETLPEHEETCNVISTKLVAGRPVIRTHASARPGPDFEAADPDLEDVYFTQMRTGAREDAPVVA